MRTCTLWLVGLCMSPSALLGTGTDQRAVIQGAARKLLAEGHAWETQAETRGPIEAGESSRGAIARDGCLYASLSPGAGIEIGRQGTATAVLLEGNWMTLAQAAARSGGELAQRLSALAPLKLPAAEAEELAARVSNLQQDGELFTGRLNPEAAGELLSGRGGGRRDDPVKSLGGTAEFLVKEGTLRQLTLTLKGTRWSGGKEAPLELKVVTRFSQIGSAVVNLPADARDIVESIARGSPSPVFVPEPGFRKLFNGRDLAGWAGRSEHWSVEDGAITGRTTRENPARGNNFLVARNGDKSLIVADFELRFSYRIVANNAAGFANSGVQYRSKELPNFVVAGYQADFEAGSQFSGILYDEAGGAGGRGIMANRGESVIWGADGHKRVEGQLADSAEIQKSIKLNDWNDYVIIAEGTRLEHFINGVQAMDATDEHEAKRLKSGVLAIQIHAGEPMTVQVKNVRIRTLGSPDRTGGSNLKAANGFKVEVLYTVPKETEGSWVALCTDPKGRLIVSDQNGPLYRLTVPRSGARVVRPERINLEIGGAHGLLWAFDSLYVMVNEKDPRGLYRVRDTDGDDRFDKVELLREIQGRGEHGLHSMVLSPDGKSLYVVCGNSTTLTRLDASLVPQNWSEDDLLPRLPTGFMDDSLAPQGWIARTDPEGKSWELVAMGFRNPFDMALNRVGELFTYDADMEWDIGDPWYRPTRVNHVTSGAEFGFRNGNGKWPEYYLDSCGKVANLGPGSPTGITFGYGARFPAKYQEALYLCDWSFGKLRAFHLNPDGASYTGEAEDFVSGQPLPLTDVVINPLDGAMYFTVGGRGVQSALYRVSYIGDEATKASPPDTRLQEQRDLRRRLEAFHGHADPAAVEAAWPHLADRDRVLRYAARIALEWQDPSLWREKALAEKDPRRAIAALLSLARVSSRDKVHRKETDPPADPMLRGRALAALETIDWSTLGHDDAVDLLRAYSVVMIRLGSPDESSRFKLIAKFDPLFPARNRQVNALLAPLLVYLEAPSAAGKILAAMRGALTQEEDVDYALALRTLKTGWTMPLREEYFRWFTTRAATYRGGNTFESSLRTLKAQAVELLSPEEKTALKPILEAAPEHRSLAEILAARKFVKEWKLDELLPIVDKGLQGGRDPERGRRLFGLAGCAACHRFEQDGGAVGPDLTGVAGRFSVHDLLESMVEPNKVISDQYAAITIQKKNGELISGRVGNLFGTTLNIVENMFEPGRMANVNRADIESMEISRVSMMPEGLLNSLEQDEILDLVAYLLARGNSKGPASR